jgi:hypothetical protein
VSQEVLFADVEQVTVACFLSRRMLATLMGDFAFASAVPAKLSSTSFGLYGGSVVLKTLAPE